MELAIPKGLEEGEELAYLEEKGWVAHHFLYVDPSAISQRVTWPHEVVSCDFRRGPVYS
jgi:hypothetical protein